MRKWRHRLEEFETIFKERDLDFDPDDDRFDAVSDVSSEDDPMYDKDYKREYLYLKSDTSCKVSEIQNIIYGGFSSRFWLFRKYMNSTNTKHLADKNRVSFYAWECLTL